MLRENVLREIASRAVRDPDFLRKARQNLDSTLARHGYDLTDEEMRLVEDLRRRTVGKSGEQLARALSDGFVGSTGTPPVLPASANWRGSGPSRPARPGGEGV
jgi:hypothetical protein